MQEDGLQRPITPRWEQTVCHLMNITVISIQASATNSRITGTDGQSESLRGIARVLAKEHDVSVCALTAVSPWKKALRFRHVRSCIEKTDPDVVHLMLPTPNFFWIGEWVAKCIDQPVVVGFNASLIRNIEFFRSSVRPSHAPWIGKKVLVNHSVLGRGLTTIFRPKHVDTFVVSSAYQRQQLQAIGISIPVAVVPNHSTLESRHDQSIHCAYNFERDDERVVFGYLGHVQPSKGVSDVIESVDNLRDEVKLAIAWSGGGLNPSQFVGDDVDNVSIYGIVNKRSFFEYIDALVLPYRFAFGTQIFPNTLLEAIRFGLPVITSDLPYMDEILSDGRDALLFPPGCQSELTATLERFATNPELRDRLTKNAENVDNPPGEAETRQQLTSIFAGAIDRS